MILGDNRKKIYAKTKFL